MSNHLPGGAFLLLALLCYGCPQLPDYALPHFEPADSLRTQSGQEISYRKLTINDFQATTLPKRLAQHTANFQAHSKIQIRPTRNSKYGIHSDYLFNQTVWIGRVKTIAFEAVFIPEHSWWNPKVSPDTQAYVLQHEQIHFALMELAARELTHQAMENIHALFAIDSTREGVQEQLQDMVKTLIETKNAELLQKHTRFDQDTSLYFDPEQQQQWFDTVSRQLLENR